MAFKYNVRKKGNGINSNKHYYAYPVKGRNLIDTEHIASDLSSMSSISQGDVLSVLKNMSLKIQFYLQEGMSVKLDGMGTFSLSITSDAYDKEEDIMPHRVRVNKICYQADKALKNKLKNIKFERNERK